MTELSFLVELLLNHKIQKNTKDLIAARIKEVEQEMSVRPPLSQMQMAQNRALLSTIPPAMANQSPSTIAAMMRHNGVQAADPMPEMPPIPEPQPVAIIAQTPAAVAAMNSRAQAIAASINGKTDKATGRPRKF